MWLIVALSASSCSEDATSPSHDPGSNISDDPAIQDPDLELVVIPGMVYEDIRTTRLQQDYCDKIADGVLPALYDSVSKCSRNFDGAAGQIKAASFAYVFPRACQESIISTFIPAACIPLTYRETMESRTSLVREFEVEQTGDSVQGLDATISFDHSWLGRIMSFGVTAESSYEISFRIKDMTEDDFVYTEILAENSVNAKLKKLSVSGVPVVVPVPQFSIDRTPAETYSRSMILKTGHRYRIQLRLLLTTRSAWEPFYAAAASFSGDNGPVPDAALDGFTQPGFLKWKNVTIKLDKEP